MRKETTQVDLYKKNYAIVPLKQYDTTVLTVEILSRGDPYPSQELSECEIFVSAVLADRRKVAQNRDITVTENAITILLDDAFTEVAGNLSIELTLISASETDGNSNLKVVSTYTICAFVEPDTTDSNHAARRNTAEALYMSTRAPFIDSSTGRWFIFDGASGSFKDSGISASDKIAVVDEIPAGENLVAGTLYIIKNIGTGKIYTGLGENPWIDVMKPIVAKIPPSPSNLDIPTTKAVANQLDETLKSAKEYTDTRISNSGGAAAAVETATAAQATANNAATLAGTANSAATVAQSIANSASALADTANTAAAAAQSTANSASALAGTAISAAAEAQATADAALPLAGGTMTGALTLAGNAISEMNAPPLSQVESLIAEADKGTLTELVRFTSSGLFDPSAYPSIDNKYVAVLVGGGGGGSSVQVISSPALYARYGGGGGGTVITFPTTVEPTVSYAIIVGAGGPPAQKAGNTTAFGCTAYGGSTFNHSAATSNAGGSTEGGQIMISGTSGCITLVSSGGSAAGGSSSLGTGATILVPAAGYGAGGHGGAASSAGTPGIVIIYGYR